MLKRIFLLSVLLYLIGVSHIDAAIIDSNVTSATVKETEKPGILEFLGIKVVTSSYINSLKSNVEQYKGYICNYLGISASASWDEMVAEIGNDINYEFHKGFDSGYSLGKSQGYLRGYSKGESDGKSEGWSAGYSSGYSSNYEYYFAQGNTDGCNNSNFNLQFYEFDPAYPENVPSDISDILRIEGGKIYFKNDIKVLGMAVGGNAYNESTLPIVPNSVFISPGYGHPQVTESDGWVCITPNSNGRAGSQICLLVYVRWEVSYVECY